MTRAEIIAAAERVPGWMEQNELAWLIGQASSLQPGSVWIEIGTHIGRSLLAVALALPESSQLVAVDHLLGDAIADGQTFFQTLQQAARLRPDVTIDCRRQASREAWAQMVPQSADVVFIDGGHDFESIDGDCERWPSVLKPGGMLCGHDYNPTAWPDVVRAVDTRFPQREIVAGSIWAVRLNECSWRRDDSRPLATEWSRDSAFGENAGRERRRIRLPWWDWRKRSGTGCFSCRSRSASDLLFGRFGVSGALVHHIGRNAVGASGGST